ncbi:expressed unknown protein [Seminavis robusta]|uniref:WW domain-containing protein n=1 Tax=Seminavis robusta TaxID=568900 RepID=A0A9N8H719_9STRA|nr:expressed unknown protein [Seminavis robusta]|eukprot:Sro128_g061290.1 n/a (1043) ;mRNA; f:74074-77202
MGNSPSASEVAYNQRNTSSYTSTSSAEGSSQQLSSSRRRQRQQQQQQQKGESTKPPPQQPPPQPRSSPRMRSFPGSVLLESTLCGTIDSTDDHSRAAGRDQERLWKRVDQLGLCTGGGGGRDPSFDQRDSRQHAGGGDQSTSSGSLPHRQHSLSEYSDDSIKAENTPMNATSALFARALVSEVTDNPKTMTPAAMAEREKKLLRAQQAAKRKGQGKDGPRPVGAPGGIGQPNLLGSIAHAITGGASEVQAPPTTPSATVLPPNSLQENRAQQQQNQYAPNSNQSSAAGHTGHADSIIAAGKYSVTIGLSLSRRHSTVGHPDTVTRQTAFDFNELQDRQYKYVSSTDSSGWRAGGGERGGDQSQMASAAEDTDALVDDFGSASLHPHGVPRKHPSPTANTSVSSQSQQQQFHKVAAPDTVHIPIIQIDAASPQAVDAIINALARGEIFIPHMAVLPESLSVNGISPPDLVVRFGCERNDDVPPDEWPNWCLEFMHNQLYEYFHNMGARWMKRPFSITLARKVRWKTVKHMNRYFAHAERVIDAWREKGPQYLDPQLSYIEGGATPEEVARPHGIYLLRNGVPTNYFAPNFDPPYTTKMTRSLLLNVLGKSWDKKRREWTAEPIPRLVTPSMLMAHMCGCADPGTGGFMANEVTHVGTSLGASHISDQRLVTLDQHQQQHSIHTYHDGTSAMSMTGPMQATSAATTPRSAHSSVAEEYSQTSSLSRGSRRRSKRHNQHAAPHMHVPTVPSDVSSPHAGVVPTANHLKSPRSQTSQNQNEEKKLDDEGRRQGAQEAPGKYLTFRADGQSIQDPPSVRGSTKQLQQVNGNSGPNALQGNVLASSQRMAHGAVEPRQTIKSNSRQIELSSSSSWKKKKGRDRQAHEGGPDRLPNNDSGVSLDYSMDSQNMPSGEEHRSSSGYADENEPAVRSTNGSRSSRKTPEQRQRQQQQQPQQVVTVTTDEDGLSLQESGSSEVIPTDEELFIVGWAKALDPNSGNYYYFTLDRTKTVWENPLSADTFVSGESSYFSGSGASSLHQSYQRQASR